jgi:hypothetical protein
MLNRIKGESDSGLLQSTVSGASPGTSLLRDLADCGARNSDHAGESVRVLDNLLSQEVTV